MRLVGRIQANAAKAIPFLSNNMYVLLGLTACWLHLDFNYF